MVDTGRVSSCVVPLPAGITPLLARGNSTGWPRGKYGPIKKSLCHKNMGIAIEKRLNYREVFLDIFCRPSDQQLNALFRDQHIIIIIIIIIYEFLVRLLESEHRCIT